MNTRKLLRHMAAHNCCLARRGGNQDIWERIDRQKATAVPRHKETDAILARAICRDLDVPVPKEK